MPRGPERQAQWRARLTGLIEEGALTRLPTKTAAAKLLAASRPSVHKHWREVEDIFAEHGVSITKEAPGSVKRLTQEFEKCKGALEQKTREVKVLRRELALLYAQLERAPIPSSTLETVVQAVERERGG